jgi:predicted TIM-barrel fold metal-dependent hydrolase
VDEGAFVASILPHVYLDTSLSTPWASLAVDSRLEIMLGIAPPAKVMYGSDEASEPEVIWLSAHLAREALTRVLETGIERRHLNRDAARRIGAGVLGGNARRLHGLEAGG